MNTAQNIYNKSGVYKLTCTECDKQYVGQTGRPFHIRYKEHAREYKYATNKSNYAKHLLDNQHAIKSMEECMAVLHATRKGPMLNTLESSSATHHQNAQPSGPSPNNTKDICSICKEIIPLLHVKLNK